MRKLLLLPLLIAGLFLGGGSASAMVCGGGYSQTESMHGVLEHACFEFFFNNSGGDRVSGEPVVLDITGTGVNITVSPENSASRNFADSNSSDGDVTNVGTYITTTTTNDDPLTAGVIDSDSCADQTYCRVQIRGPRLVICQDSTDAVTSGSAVGTTGTAGRCGGGSGLGVALEAGLGVNEDIMWIYIDVGGNR